MREYQATENQPYADWGERELRDRIQDNTDEIKQYERSLITLRNEQAEILAELRRR